MPLRVLFLFNVFISFSIHYVWSFRSINHPVICAFILYNIYIFHRIIQFYLYLFNVYLFNKIIKLYLDSLTKHILLIDLRMRNCVSHRKDVNNEFVLANCAWKSVKLLLYVKKKHQYLYKNICKFSFTNIFQRNSSYIYYYVLYTKIYIYIYM